jgi:hypothetical protein
MPNFQTLWKNHPNIKGDTPVLNKATYANQCAINVSASLMRSDISLKGFAGALSWEKAKPKYAIRAQELADWLRGSFPAFPRRFEKIDPKNFSKKIATKTGIIFFQNYWGPNNQGDHIDLWNGHRLTARDSWLQIYGPRFGQNRIGWNTDLRQAESIWFWGVS